MNTSYFAKLKNIENPVSIAGWPPAFYNGPKYLKLAPKKDWFFKWKEARKSGQYTEEEAIAIYKELYKRTVLDLLDPHQVYQELCNIYNTDNVTLLCYEKPGDFCHRHLVAEWLNNAGYNVTEKEF